MNRASTVIAWAGLSAMFLAGCAGDPRPFVDDERGAGGARRPAADRDVASRRAPAPPPRQSDVPGVPPTGAERIEVRDGALVPVWGPSSRATASLTLPMSASGAMRIASAEHAMRIAVSMPEARETTAELAHGMVTHRDALGPGVRLVVVPRPHGVEDFVVFEGRPVKEYVLYSIDVSEVAGLRLVANTLELLDPGGVPRLRVAPPSLVDSTGRVIGASLTVEAEADPESCRPDISPRGPWGRPVRPPCPGRAAGSPCRCTVRVDFRDADTVYPVVLDPAWTTTDRMMEPRSHHRAVELLDGRVLVTGGEREPYYQFNATTEIYDPESSTWAPTGSMSRPRSQHTITRLNDGSVLVAGGKSSLTDNLNDVEILADSELYDPATASWLPAGQMTMPRWTHTATKLSDGRVLVAGGGDGTPEGPATASAEVFDPATLGWTKVAEMKHDRRYHTAVLLPSPDERVMVIGGRDSVAQALATTEIYDPAQDQWEGGDTMGSPRCKHTTVLTSESAILVIGGRANNDVLGTTELLHAAGAGWSAGPPMSRPRFEHAAISFQGFVLVAGGDDHNFLELDTTEILMPGVPGWLDAGRMQVERHHATASAVPGRVLVAGGDDGGHDAHTTSELFHLLGPFESCKSHGECASGLCAEGGTCCDQPCHGGCVSCTAEGKGYGVDGECGQIAGNPCDGFACTESGDCKESCAADSDCIPGHACDLAAATCVDVTPICDGDGTITMANGATRICRGFKCTPSGQCLETCGSTLDCATGYTCAENGLCRSLDDPLSQVGCACTIEGSSTAGDPRRLAALIGVVAAGIAGGWRRRARRLGRRRSVALRRRAERTLRATAAAVLASASLACTAERIHGEREQEEPERVRHASEQTASARAAAGLPGALAGAVARGGIAARRDADGTLTAEVGAADRALHVRLPASAAGPVRLEHAPSSMRVGIQMIGGRDAPLRLTSDAIVYEGGAPTGEDIEYRLREDGVEDIVRFGARPGDERLRYRVELSGVAGVRFVSRTLELLDRRGAPQLRMSPPHVIDSSGRHWWASVSVEGCRHDTSPRPPWRRALVAPCASGASGEPAGECACEITVSWDALELDYPVLVDPAWVATGDMAFPRTYGTMNALPDGPVIAAGGNGGALGTLASTEYFDVETRTWAAGPALTSPREAHRATLLPGQRLLLTGGRTVEASVILSDTAEIFTLGSATWEPTKGKMIHEHADHAAVALTDGRVVVTGGAPDRTSAESFDPDDGFWEPLPDMSEERGLHTSSLLPDGSLIVIGGDYYPSATTEVLSLEGGVWQPGPPLNKARTEHAAGVLADGTVFVVGGLAATSESSCCNEATSIELLAPGAADWELGPPMFFGRRALSAVVLENDFILVAGGDGSTDELNEETSAEIFDTHHDRWSPVIPLTAPRVEHMSVALDGGGALLAGGKELVEGTGDSTEIWEPAMLGMPCDPYGAECASGFCSGGVCCDTECTGDCITCVAALKSAGPDGICGARAEAPCGGYACDDGMDCHKSCVTDEECAAGHGCNGEGECVPWICDGEHTIEGVTRLDCWPYRCTPDNQCLSSCGSTLDCVAGHRCDVSGQCLDADASVGAPVGCACALPAAADDTRGALVLAALGIACTRRRRYRTRRCPLER